MANKLETVSQPEHQKTVLKSFHHLLEIKNRADVPPKTRIESTTPNLDSQYKRSVQLWVTRGNYVIPRDSMNYGAAR